MKYKVHEYHGRDGRTHDQLKRICEINVDTGYWEFTGSLDDFAEFYNGVFSVSKDRTIIFVTPYNSWGMR